VIDLDVYLSRKDAARRLGCSTRTIDRLREEGELEEFTVGSRVVIEIASILAYEQRQRARRKPATPAEDFQARFPIRALEEIRAAKAARRAAEREDGQAA
jgi:excisionase family DNA binding protein